MREENPAEVQASQPGNAKAVAVEEPVMDARKPIETASTGSGTVNDSSGKDTRPPVTDDFESLPGLV
jgi:hypothetical protein